MTKGLVAGAANLALALDAGRGAARVAPRSRAASSSSASSAYGL